jgi:hypothetical protein
MQELYQFAVNDHKDPPKKDISEVASTNTLRQAECQIWWQWNKNKQKHAVFASPACSGPSDKFTRRTNSHRTPNPAKHSLAAPTYVISRLSQQHFFGAKSGHEYKIRKNIALRSRSRTNM